jgi:N-acetylglutamate synthase-like GNAT family acetyltransferase
MTDDTITIRRVDYDALCERIDELETERMMLRASLSAATMLLVKWRYWMRQNDGEMYARVLGMASDAEMWTREVAA